MANAGTECNCPRAAHHDPVPVHRPAYLLGCCGFRRRDDEGAQERRGSGELPLALDRRGDEAAWDRQLSADEERLPLLALSRRSRFLSRRSVPLQAAGPGGPDVGGALEAALAGARGLLASGLARGWLLPSTREELEAASELLSAAEQQLRGLARTPQGARRSATLGDPLAALLEAEPVTSWLLQTFTRADPEAAEGHHLLPPSPLAAPARPRPAMPKRLRSSAELDQSIHAALHDPAAEALLERAGCLDFDSLAFAELPNVGLRPLQVLGSRSLDRRGIVRTLCDQGQVRDSSQFSISLVRFLGEIDELYRADIPYHTAVHAADVMMTMEWFMGFSYLRERLTPLDHLMAVVASAIHDVGHPGRNNLFLAKTMSPEAIRYNDKSILENMHLALSFETMQRDAGCNWFALLPRAYQRQDDEPDAPAVNLQHYMRRGLIDMVLGTDMARHAEHVHHLEDFLLETEEEAAAAGAAPAAAGHARKQEALERKLFLLTTAMHAADISNPCKPRPLMLGWTQRVLDEFWAQGDEERARGMDVSFLCDRESGRLAVAKGQVGFISFVVQPLYAPLAQLLPDAREAAELLASNRAFWEEHLEALPEELFA